MKWLDGSKGRLTLIGFITVGFLSPASICMAQEYTWMQKADMPTPRWSHTSAMVNGKIYVIGGSANEPADRNEWIEILSTLEEYNPATDTWTRKADIPTTRGWTPPSSPVVDGKIYVIGGWDGRNVTSIVEEYETVTDTWTRKTDMPTTRNSLATVTVDGKIYAIGGTPPDENRGMKVLEVYNPATDTWTRKADMPTGVWGLCACIVDGKIYALGGRPGTTAIPTVQEYDPATDTWTRKADMPVGTSQMVSAVLDNKIFVIGGWYWSVDFPYTTVQMYDPEADIWTIEGDAPFLRACFSAEVVNNRIYAIGGTDRPHPCPATSTVYELTINPPPPDFNGDGIIDSADMCIMIDHWGEDYPLCDIAPPPFGDDIVDVQDLIVLAEHLFEEVEDPTLVAHWAMDEAEGNIASDSANDNDGTVYGDPAWQPEGGTVYGALQLDGIDDYVSTPFVLNPANGKFSILTWVKGGAPGQAVLSQAGSANWLYADALEGNLMTELKEPGRGANELLSQTVITDGNWHRIGFVWDGSNRALYVDDLVVAEDTQRNLEGSEGGLYIGTGKAMEPGCFWSGLIDDVRIYNRVVKP